MKKGKLKNNNKRFNIKSIISVISYFLKLTLVIAIIKSIYEK